MWAGSRIRYLAPLPVGAEATRTSRILKIAPKEGRAGRMCFVTVEHTIAAGGHDCIVEAQDIVFREASPPGAAAEPPPAEAAPIQWQERLVPGTPLLFRYSALTFNGHRIHYDQPYARDVEGYRGLVVHGPLSATLLQRFAQACRPGARLAGFDFKGVSPLFVDEALQLQAWADADDAGLLHLPALNAACARDAGQRPLGARMTSIPPPLLRSLLFVPGNRADRFEKAAATGAHGVLLDLEDAVAPEAKASARTTVAAWLAGRAAGGAQAIVRINGVGSDWHRDDLQWVAGLPAGVGVMCPKSEPGSLPAVAARLGGKRPLYALVETVAGVLGLRAMAAVPGLTRFAFGNVDFGVDAGITPDEDEIELTAVLTAFVLESRLAGLPAPIDGVSLEVSDTARMARHAARARRFGFGGKLCIHPRQVTEVNAAFRPSEADIAWAQGVIAAFEASGGAAVAHGGRMIDRPVAERAQQLLALAGV